MNDRELAEIFANINLEEYMEGPLDTLSKILGLREVTMDELAMVLGLTDRRISQLWKDGIIPEPRYDGKRHWFPLLGSVQGYIAFLRDR